MSVKIGRYSREVVEKKSVYPEDTELKRKVSTKAKKRWQQKPVSSTSQKVAEIVKKPPIQNQSDHRVQVKLKVPAVPPDSQALCSREPIPAHKQEECKDTSQLIDVSLNSPHMAQQNSLLLPIQIAPSWTLDDDYGIEIEFVQQQAASGDRVTQCMLGKRYELGITCERSYSQAIYWYSLSAKNGYPNGQYNLAFMYASAKGTAENLAEAVRLIMLAADQDYAPAQNGLGYCYEKGIIVKQDLERAFQLYDKAAKLLFPPAITSKGICYEDGIGCKKDSSEAFKEYRIAAQLGYPPAQNNLAICYQLGIGCEKNVVAAFFWYDRAAKQNLAEAQCNLGDYFQNGINGTKNLEEALKWYKVAATNGNARAQSIIGKGLL